MKYDCLIIDDEVSLADNTCEYLNMFGINSKACYSIAECEEFFKENEAALILLDINLTDGSGFELCKKLRNEMDIPILFISARNTDDDKIIALNIGGDDYIEKPYSLGVLLAKVKVMLKRLEVRKYIESMEHVNNVRLLNDQPVETKETTLNTYILDNDGKLKNQDACYDGRLPQYENEVAISGKYCISYNYKIGDEIELGIGDKKAKYIITGFIQSTNNNGQEAVMLENGVKRILDKDFDKVYYFDVDEGTDIDECLDKIKEKFGDRISSAVNFKTLVEGSLSIFKMISNMMVVSMLSISALIILLVLYLLIKTLINNKKKDYGILKAIGYTSNDVIMQNAISFMPPIILSVIISCIVSSKIANPYITQIMKTFGVMKATFVIPTGYVAIMGIGFIIISFLFAYLLSRKIRKIEAYNLLRGE